MMTRRTLGLGAVGAAAAGLGARLFGSTSEAKNTHVYPVSHSEAEWKQQLTPEQYRQRWGLPFSYPLVAPDYAKMRSALAKKIGLSRLGSALPRQSARKATSG